MKFITIVLGLIGVALAALFIIKGSDALLLMAIAAVIVGFGMPSLQFQKSQMVKILKVHKKMKKRSRR